MRKRVFGGLKMRRVSIAIIGGGPAGLYAAGRLEEEKADYLLFEAGGTLGGQLVALYPEKPVVDVNMFPEMKAKDMAAAFASKVDMNRVLLNSPVSSMEEKDDGVHIIANGEETLADKVILATGLGFHKPRPLGLEGEDRCKNIIYAVKDPDALKGSKVVIFGGGDSALDWARNLSKIADVSIVHRRTEWRGDPKTIEGCKLDIYMPYIPHSLKVEGDKAVEVTIEERNEHSLIALPCDYICVNFGNIPSPSTFGLPLADKGFGVVPKEGYKVTDRIYAIGDCVFDPNRKKRMQPAIEEADIVLKDLRS
jgi:thioredoxin reductase (NADPH)